MNTTRNSDLVEVDLRLLLISLWKKRKLLLLVLFVCAALVGGVHATSMLRQGEEPVLSSTEIEQRQTQLTSDQNTLDADKAELKTKQQSLVTQKESRDNYAEALEEAEEVKDKSVTDISAILELNEKLDEANNQVDSTEARIKTLQKEIKEKTSSVDLLTAEITATQPVFSAGEVVKYAVIGGILGILLVCLYCLILAVQDKTVQTADQLTRQFGLPVLGNLAAPIPETGSRLSRRITRKENAIRFGDTAADLAQVASRVAFLAGDTGEIVLTGTQTGPAMQRAAEAIQAELPAVVLTENPLMSAAVPEAVKSCPVILLESIGKTNCTALAELTAFLRLGKAQIIGTILVSPEEAAE